MTDFGPVYTLAERNRYKDKYAEGVNSSVRLFSSWMNYANPAVWRAIAINYLGTEVDPTNLQEIETNLALAKQKIREHWFICMMCKWKHKYVNLKITNPEIDIARSEILSNSERGVRMYETEVPEINWMMYMKNELDLIYQEYFMLSGIAASHNKAGITVALNQKWQSVKQKPLSEMSVEMKEKISNLFNKKIVKEQAQKTDITTLQPFLLDIVDKGKTIRDIVYDFNIMVRNYMLVLNNNIASSDCECCREACNTATSPCTTKGVCTNYKSK